MICGMKLPRFSLGMGDRFAHQGLAQLSAIVEARKLGIDVAPVWNKSNREHSIVGSHPDDLRTEADAAVKSLGWTDAYFVDADHINLDTVDRFLAGSDVFTLDVADSVGEAPSDADRQRFIKHTERWLGQLDIPGIEGGIELDATAVSAAADQFLAAIVSAGKIYRKIEGAKGAGNFITEVSIDETDAPQSPVELFLILSMIAAEGVPVQTIAPKFTGRFNKGVNYVGDLKQFEKEFDQDLCVIAFAVEEFGLPVDLKLSVHSGSDKFSIYPIIRELIRKHDAGLHVKTAGTTWLEEVIGLAEAGGEGLEVARAIYAGAYERFDELTAPYSTVIDIDPEKLPSPGVVMGWGADDFVESLRHVQSCDRYNPHFRQLLHVGFKIAAEMGARYTDALKANEATIAGNVKTNLLDRHIRRLFPAG